MLEFRIHSTAGFQPTAIIVKTNGELQFGVIATRGWIMDMHEDKRDKNQFILGHFRPRN